VAEVNRLQHIDFILTVNVFNKASSKYKSGICFSYKLVLSSKYIRIKNENSKATNLCYASSTGFNQCIQLVQLKCMADSHMEKNDFATYVFNKV